MKICGPFTVLNRRTQVIPEGSVYCGRPGPWGNPFKSGVDGTREEVIDKHREWFLSQPELIEKARRELRHKNLVCWCSPKPCHADILFEVANSGTEDEYFTGALSDFLEKEYDL